MRHANQERIDRAFQTFPWRGGFSIVNFYERLKFATPKPLRPDIVSIRYASPGAIELLLNIPVVLQVSMVVFSVASTIGLCNKVYSDIYKGLQQRKLLRIEVEKMRLGLRRRELEFVLNACQEIGGLLGISDLNELHERTGDPLVSAKVLLSYYRRVRDLAEYTIMGKAKLPPPN